MGKASCPLQTNLAEIDTPATDRSAVPANELRRGVDHDVCAPFDGPAQRWRRCRVVDDKGQLLIVGDFSQTLDVEYVEFGIADCFRVNSLCLFVNCSTQTIVI